MQTKKTNTPQSSRKPDAPSAGLADINKMICVDGNTHYQISKLAKENFRTIGGQIQFMVHQELIKEKEMVI